LIHVWFDIGLMLLLVIRECLNDARPRDENSAATSRSSVQASSLRTVLISTYTQ